MPMADHPDPSRPRSAAPSRRGVLAGGAALAAALRWSPGLAAGIPAGTVLKVGDQKGGSQSVLEAAGLLKDLPYAIEWRQFPAAAPLLEALNAGAIETGYAGDAPTTFALAAGARAKIIAAVRSTNRNTAILVPANSPIRSVADLKGRTIGTSRGSIGHYLLLAAGREAGLAPGDVRLASLLPTDAKTALAGGSIDAWATWGIYTAQATLRDGLRVLVNGEKRMSGLNYQSATLDAIATKREALADLVGRLAVARQWALDNIDAYSEHWGRTVGVDTDIARDAFANDRFRAVPIDPRVLADQQATADLWHGTGIIPVRVDSGAVFDPSFNTALPA